MIAGSERHRGFDNDRARGIQSLRKPGRRDGECAEFMRVKEIAPRNAPVYRRNRALIYRGLTVDRGHRALDRIRLGDRLEMRDQQLPFLMESLRARTEHRRTRQ